MESENKENLTSVFYRSNNEHLDTILANRDTIEQCNAEDLTNSLIGCFRWKSVNNTLGVAVFKNEVSNRFHKRDLNWAGPCPAFVRQLVGWSGFRASLGSSFSFGFRLILFRNKF